MPWWGEDLAAPSSPARSILGSACWCPGAHFSGRVVARYWVAGQVWKEGVGQVGPRRPFSVPHCPARPVEPSALGDDDRGRCGQGLDLIASLQG